MRSTRHIILAAAGLLPLVVLAFALGVAPVYAAAPETSAGPDARPPTAVEQALAVMSCGATITDAHYHCVSAGVAALRVRFGYDLSLLTKAERQTIDKSCGHLRAADGDSYIMCVSRALAPLHTGTIQPADTSVDTSGVTAAPELPRTLRASNPWMWLTALLAVGFLGVGALVAVPRIKAARHRCNSCGARVQASGDLCVDCRKRAAEAIRQAAHERAQHELEEQQRKAQDAHRAQEELEARARQEEETRRRVLEAETRRKEDEARRASAPDRVEPRQDDHADAAVRNDEPDEFDPHAVLGVAWDAGPKALLAAYEAARKKYDPEVVSQFGDEVQAHYRAKADAVDRAYRLLGGVSPA
jgi:hypothetical protein